MRCLSVCPSRSWIVSKRINISSKFFHHLVFLRIKCYVECRWDRLKSRFSTNICMALRSVTAVPWLIYRTLRPGFCWLRISDDQAPCAISNHGTVTVYSARPTKRGLALYSHGRPWIVCMTARFDVTPKTTEQNWIVRTGKYDAEVTSDKRTVLEAYY